MNQLEIVRCSLCTVLIWMLGEMWLWVCEFLSLFSSVVEVD